MATDNHVGYAERDPVRGNDSVITFDEIMKLARERDVSHLNLLPFVAGVVTAESNPAG